VKEESDFVRMKEDLISLDPDQETFSLPARLEVVLRFIPRRLREVRWFTIAYVELITCKLSILAVYTRLTGEIIIFERQENGSNASPGNTDEVVVGSNAST
jgi:hypothetical protein